MSSIISLPEVAQAASCSKSSLSVFAHLAEIGNAPSLADFLGTLVDVACAAAASDGAAIAVLEADGSLRLQTARGLGAEHYPPGGNIRAILSVVGAQVLDQDSPLSLEHTQTDQHLSAGLRADLTLNGILSAYLIPLRCREKGEGLFCAFGGKANRFSPADRLLLRSLAALAAVGVVVSRLEREEKRLQVRLGALLSLTDVTLADLGFHQLLNLTLERLVQATSSNSGAILLFNAPKTLLRTEAVYNLPPAFRSYQVPPGVDPGGIAAQTGQRVKVVDTLTSPGRLSPSLSQFTSLIACPLVVGNEVIGILQLHGLASTFLSGSGDDAFLGSLAERTARTIRNAFLLRESQQLYANTIRALAKAVDVKDHHSRNHSDNVAAYSRAIAQQIGLPSTDVEAVTLAATLHDVGKIGIADAIIAKPSRLNPDEWALMLTHPEIGAGLLEQSEETRALAAMVRHHHERWEGTGYPARLKQDEIPLGASIIAVADAFDTMTTDRPYREALSWAEAKEELSRHMGKQFSPEVSEALLAFLAQKGDHLPFITQGCLEVGNNGPSFLPITLPRSRHRKHGPLELLQRLGSRLENMLDYNGVAGEFLRSFQEYLNASGGKTLLWTDSPGPNFEYSLGDFTSPCDCAQEGSVCREVWERQTGIIVNFAQGQCPLAAASSTGSEIIVPIVRKERTSGVFILRKAKGKPFNTNDLAMLRSFSPIFASALEVASRYQEAKRAAGIDYLTQTVSRRAVLRALREEIARARRYTRIFSVVLLDVNELKKINDNYGHLMGDEALRQVTATLVKHIRNTDILGRYGGDEFLLLLSETDVEGAIALVSRTVEELLHTTISTGQEKIPCPTFAWGCAEFPRDGEEETPLLAQADRRLYHRKWEREKEADRDLLLSDTP